MLMARDREGRWVYAPHMTEEQTVTSYYCPQCGRPLMFKKGSRTIGHFAHFPNEACERTFSEGETKEHIAGKMQLYEWFQRYVEKVELEPFLPTLSQRPDLLIGRIPIEFQCSQISLTLLQRRTTTYRQHGYEPLWILMTPQRFQGRERVTSCRMTQFQYHFLLNDGDEKQLITYDPVRERFTYVTLLYHIQGMNYIVSIKHVPLDDQTIPFADVRVTERERFEGKHLYDQKRKEYVYRSVRYNRRGVQHPLLRSCYEMRLSPFHLPHWIGQPVPHSDAFSEHDLEWQVTWYYYVSTRTREEQHALFEQLSPRQRLAVQQYMKRLSKNEARTAQKVAIDFQS